MIVTNYNDIILRHEVIEDLEMRYGPDADFSREKWSFRIKGVKFSDIARCTQYDDINHFIDDHVSDGFVFSGIDYRIVGYDKKTEGAIIEVTIEDIEEWLNLSKSIN
jgi:hypothetical protein